MLYWGFEDDLALAVLILSVVNIYFALAIARIAAGAPRGWYVLISAFVVNLGYRGIELYFDVQTPNNIIAVDEATIALILSILIVLGLSMLNSSFRRRAKIAQAL